MGKDGGTLTNITTKSVSNGGTYFVDITDNIKALGTNKWINIRFVPDNTGHDALMRIEANAYVQMFIKST